MRSRRRTGYRRTISRGCARLSTIIRCSKEGSWSVLKIKPEEPMMVLKSCPQMFSSRVCGGEIFSKKSKLGADLKSAPTSRQLRRNPNSYNPDHKLTTLASSKPSTLSRSSRTSRVISLSTETKETALPPLIRERLKPAILIL